ncbi:hypothetical protein HUS23_06110 [Ectothiorhodospiraceae bacterium 2226]|nr:hypothetical protein HUS23_06110 [Ectothiorhodospiraceae bacterium 2226]
MEGAFRRTRLSVVLPFTFVLYACGGGTTSGNSALASEAPLPGEEIFEEAALIDADNALSVAGAAHHLSVDGQVGGETEQLLEDNVNADAGASWFLDVHQRTLRQLDRWHAIGFGGAQVSNTIPCDVGGEVEATLTSTGVRIRYDQCDDGQGEVLHGVVELRDLELDETAPGVVDGTATVVYEDLQITFHDERPTQIGNGTLELAWHEDSNTWQATDRFAGTLVLQLGEEFAGFQDAERITVENWTAQWGGLLDWENTVRSMRTASSALGGYVDLATPTPVTGDAHEACPLGGIVRADGAQGSVLEVLYGEDATGAVDIHLNGEPFASYSSCQPFLENLD